MAKGPTIEKLQKQIVKLQQELDELKAKDIIGFFDWEKNGVVSKSANIIVAPEDYWEYGDDGEFGVVDGKKRYFTWDEAMEAAKKIGNGWRLPTPHEMMHLIAEFGLDENGNDDPEKFMNELGFKKNGYCNYFNDSLDDKGLSGFYWESRANSAVTAFNLYFYSTSLLAQDGSNKSYGFSVHLVKDIADNSPISGAAGGSDEKR